MVDHCTVKKVKFQTGSTNMFVEEVNEQTLHTWPEAKPVEPDLFGIVQLFYLL